MLFSYKWLQSYLKKPLPSPKKLAELILNDTICWPYEVVTSKIFSEERRLLDQNKKETIQ